MRHRFRIPILKPRQASNGIGANELARRRDLGAFKPIRGKQKPLVASQYWCYITNHVDDLELISKLVDPV